MTHLKIVTLIYLCVHKQWLSLICHIFLYFLTHTKHTYGSVQWFFTFLFHTCYWPTCYWLTTFLATSLHNEITPPTYHLDLILQPWRQKQSIPPKRQNLPTKLYGTKSMRTTCEKLMPWKCRNLQILRWCTVWQGLLRQNDCKRRVPVTYWSNCSI